ncbi:MAG: hypothetical protein Q8L48_25510 [Archangium sp.]|nr:hypothetical protein [Archangium sp.]
MSISLTNLSRRCQVFVLAHDVFCAALGRCACRTGARRVASSLTLASGVTVDSLDDAVLAVPEVIRAVREGALSVKRGAA